MSDVTLIDCFVDSLGIEKARVVDTLEYNTIPEWDSIGHMTLIAELEEQFNITLDTDDIIDMRSVNKTKEILSKHGVEF